MYLSESRAVITREMHAEWAKKIEEVLSRPDVAEAAKDSRRNWNNVGLDYKYFYFNNHVDRI